MSWAFQGVANACIQILLLIAVGYGMTWRGWVGDKFLPQANTFLLLISFPSLNLNSIGINLNLQDAAGWKAIAAYIMWLAIIQVCIVVYVWLFAKRDVGEAAILNLLLSANNTIIIGLPLMDATFGTKGRYISLLTAVPLFVQVMPFSIILFEMEKWIVQEAVGAASSDNLAGLAGHAHANSAGLPGSSNSLAGLIQPTESVATSEDGAAAANGLELAPLPSTDSASSVAQPVARAHPGYVTDVTAVIAPTSSTGQGMARESISITARGAGATADSATDAMPKLEGPRNVLPQPQQVAGNNAATGAAVTAAAQDLGSFAAQAGGPVAGAVGQTRITASKLQLTISGESMQQATATAVADGVVDTRHVTGNCGDSAQRGQQHLHHHPHRLSHQTGPESGLSNGAEESGTAIPHRHSQYQHRDKENHVSGPASASEKPLTKTYSFSQQWHAALQHLAELKKRRKQAKHQRRQMLSVVDVPLFTGPEVQLGQSQVQHATGPDGHQYHGLDDRNPRGVTDSETRPENTWEALNRLLSRGRLSLSRIAGSFGRRQDMAGPLSQLDSDDHTLDNSLPQYHTNPLASQQRGNGADGYGSRGMGVERSDPSAVRLQVVEKAMHRAVRKHGGFVKVVAQYVKIHTRLLIKVVIIICKNPMLWSLLLAVVISASGLRQYLDTKSSHYVIELGWLVQALAMCSATTVPVALFSNGVFLYGKRFWEGNIKKAVIIVAIKIVLLPALQLLCAKLLHLDTASAMSLVLLSVCPCATTAFVVASQYNHGTEVITLCTIVLTTLLVPLMLAALNLPKALGLYDFDSAAFPLP